MYDILQYFKKGFYYFNIKLWNTLIISLNLYDFLGHFQPIVAHGHYKHQQVNSLDKQTYIYHMDIVYMDTIIFLLDSLDKCIKWFLEYFYLFCSLAFRIFLFKNSLNL